MPVAVPHEPSVANLWASSGADLETPSAISPTVAAPDPSQRLPASGDQQYIGVLRRPVRRDIEFAAAYAIGLYLSSPGFAVPALHVLCVCVQVGTGLEETVIEVEVQMMGLDVAQDGHGRHGARELAERVEGVLRLQRHASFELVVVDLRASADAWAIAPGAGCRG
jgi:hypothetical protein